MKRRDFIKACAVAAISPHFLFSSSASTKSTCAKMQKDIDSFQKELRIYLNENSLLRCNSKRIDLISNPKLIVKSNQPFFCYSFEDSYKGRVVLKAADKHYIIPILEVACNPISCKDPRYLFTKKVKDSFLKEENNLLNIISPYSGKVNLITETDATVLNASGILDGKIEYGLSIFERIAVLKGNNIEIG